MTDPAVEAAKRAWPRSPDRAGFLMSPHGYHGIIRHETDRSQRTTVAVSADSLAEATAMVTAGLPKDWVISYLRAPIQTNHSIEEDRARKMIARGRALERLRKAHWTEFGKLYHDELEKMSDHLLRGETK